MLLFFSTLLVRIVVSFFIPIVDDEAYYWVWSHFPSLSYYDHPGMIAWIIGIGRILFPWGMGFRVPGIILSHVGIFLWYALIRKSGPKTLPKCG